MLMLSFLFPARVKAVSKDRRRTVRRKRTLDRIGFGELSAVVQQFGGNILPMLALRKTEVDVC